MIPAGNLTQPIFPTTPTRAGGRELGNQNISSLFGRQPNLSQQPSGLADLVNLAPNLTPGEADAIRSRFAPPPTNQDIAGARLTAMSPRLLGQEFGSNSPDQTENTAPIFGNLGF